MVCQFLKFKIVGESEKGARSIVKTVGDVSILANGMLCSILSHWEVITIFLYLYSK